MAITFTKVTDIALNADEANRLRGEIYARIESADPGRNTDCVIPDFKMDNGKKVKITWKWVANNKKDYDVELR
jgi:hypothetical protein